MATPRKNPEKRKRRTASGRNSPLFILVAVITTITALYVAKAILLPVSLAILLTFLLTPLADRLERWRIPRIPTVLSIVGISFALIASLGGVVTNQLFQLSMELPKHEENLKAKIASLQPNSPALEKVTQTLKNLRNAITQGSPRGGEESPKPAPGEKPQSPTKSSDESRAKTKTVVQTDDKSRVKNAAESAAGQSEKSSDSADMPASIAVQVVAPSQSLFARSQEWIGQLVAPLASAGLVIVLVLFMLLDRENQRSRFVQLFGRSHMHATAEAVHDVAHRVGRYLRMLFLLNAGYGLAIATGLWVIGVPGAIMWGVLGFTLRFLPYIGPWIAATLPIMVSIATAEGWTQPLLVVGWYIVVELISNNVVEPLVYGSTTGVSTVGIIIAAIFWTWLWGPVGLILSVPMTVCLLVAARYVPQLNFLTILLGDGQPTSAAERVYQRLLAFDDREPTKLAHKQLKETPLVNYYDEVLLPALVMAEQDRHADLLNDEQATFVIEATEDLIEDLGKAARREQQLRHAESAVANMADGNVVAPAATTSARVLCIPLRDEADELASHMLVQILNGEGFEATAAVAESLTSEIVDQIAESESDIVVISVLPPIAPRGARLVWRRIRDRYPDLPIVVGFWTVKGDREELAEPVEDATSRAVTTLAEAVSVVRALAAQPKLVRSTS